MSESAARAQRATALEEKRKRLEEMRARREQRGADSAASSAKATASRGNLDEYIDDLLGGPAPVGGVAAPAATAETEAPALVAETAAPPSQAPADTTSNNVIAEAAPAPPVKTVETFTISTQTSEEDFPEQVTPEPDEEPR